MNRKAVIFGIKGYRLTSKEKKFLKKTKPWGIILFSRNIKNISQLKNLIDEIKKILHDKKYPILIDQEGGRVSRLNKIVNLSFFSQDFFGKLYNKDKKLFYKVYKIYVNKVCDIFKKVGININTSPVLDVRRKKTHKVIGDRSFSLNPYNVSKLGKICINLYKKNKIAAVTKHIPGHGLSEYDSHYKTPIIKTNKKELIKTDFKPFKICKSLFAMTAHVIYSVYDLNNTVTHSKIIIEKVIRNYINFKGLLISDDISMKSLKYNLTENAIKALQAGCNLVLHCNGKMNEMSKLAKVIPKIDNFTKEKTSHFYKFLG
jgi:beta-N-acetylhexosaminidase